MQNFILVAKDDAAVKIHLEKLFKNHSILPTNVVEVQPEKNGITADQLREVISLTARNFAQPTAFVIWGFDSAKELLQNIFLKTLEEHQEQLMFILVSSSEGAILPTIASRGTMVFLQSTNPEIEQKDQDLVRSTLSELKKNPHILVSTRLSLSPTKKKEQALSFIHSLLHVGYAELLAGKEKKWLASILKKAIISRKLMVENYVDPELAIDNIFLP